VVALAVSMDLASIQTAVAGFALLTPAILWENSGTSKIEA
jgi:hypothetical protein